MNDGGPVGNKAPNNARELLADIEAYLVGEISGGETLDTYQLDELDYDEIEEILDGARYAE